MSDLISLRNLGLTSAQMLMEVGIDSRTELERLGAAMAFQIVRHRRPDVSLNLLWALHGALTDRDWRSLSADEKARLRAEVAVPLRVRPG
ncbi:MAG: TfoX/Sxy family protein [Bacteroidota bacterium]